MTPETVGRYHIQSEIGKGGMATVYQAYDPRFNREVALKLLPSQFLHDPQFRERFQREAQAIARLEHTAIVPVYDYGEDNEQPYLVMRYMAGGSLTDWLQRGPLPLPTAVNIVNRLTSALNEAHQQGLIHRDLKPSNVLLDHRGDAFLSDFGIVKISENSAGITGSAILGTPAYMSPEQIHGDQTLDGRSDIYALGVLLFEMLSGEKPYDADTPAKVMMAHALKPIPDIQRINQELPPGCQTIVEKAMAKERDERYRSGQQLAHDLNLLLTPLRPSAAAIDERTNRTQTRLGNPGSGQRRRLYLIAALVIITLIFFFGWRWYSTAQETAAVHTPTAEVMLDANPTATETATVTATIPTSPTPTLTVTPAPTGSGTAVLPLPAATQQFTTISMKAASFLATPETNLGLTPGIHRLADIPFEVGWKVSTQCERHAEEYQTAVDINVSIDNPHYLYLLIQAGQALRQDEGKAMGEIQLVFADGRVLIEPLVIGYNIRDWRRNLPDLYINTLTAFDAQEAWEGSTAEGIDGRIDLLTLTIPEPLQSQTLQNIQLVDTSVDTIGSLDPCIHVMAMTVEN